MAKLAEQIDEDIKQAMRNKRAILLSALRLLKAAIKNKEITLRRGEEVELTEEQIIEVVSSEIKKRQEASELYNQGGRAELADKEKKELEILEKYLPEQLSDEELKKIIAEVIASGADNFGKIMRQVMVKVKGKAEGAKVGELVKKMLNK